MRDNGFILGPDDDTPPEFYADAIRIGMTVYGFMFELGSAEMPEPSQTHPEGTPIASKRLALVKMSPQHAAVFSKLLQRHLTMYQEKFGRINVPPEVYRGLGLEPEEE